VTRRQLSRAAHETETVSLTARIEELENARDRLEDFAAFVAHELVKPLIIAQSCAAGLLADGEMLDAPSQADLEDVVRACARARRVADELLADAQQPDPMMHREPVDMTRVVRECIAELAPEIERRHVRVKVYPLPMVSGNAVLLGVVFRNLIANAVEHGLGPDREVRVFAESSERRWTFAVDSPGPPIPEERRHQMFEDVRGGSRGRAGLGLMLVRRIVERHGGMVGVVSPNGYMNRFLVKLASSSEGRLSASRKR
jgi:signal transduction histidine kinase